MDKKIKSSFLGSLLITSLYLVLFYPLILINRFDWYDLLLVMLSISPGIFIMILIYNLDEYNKEPLWLLAISFILGAINLHLDVDILEYAFSFINVENNFIRIAIIYKFLNINFETINWLIIF